MQDWSGGGILENGKMPEGMAKFSGGPATARDARRLRAMQAQWAWDALPSETKKWARKALHQAVLDSVVLIPDLEEMTDEELVARRKNKFNHKWVD